MTKVLQLQSIKIGQQALPMMSLEIVDHLRAREILAAQHTRAIAAGYTSTLDPATGSSSPKGPNWVEFTAPADSTWTTSGHDGPAPTITIRQHFTMCGQHYYTPFSAPISGQWQDGIDEHGNPIKIGVPPDPNFAPIPGPASPGIDINSEVIAVFGQSNADGSGPGKYTGQVPSPPGGGGCYYFDADSTLQYYTLSDPTGGGGNGKGWDAGPWCRLGAKSLGLSFPGFSNNINRCIIWSGAQAGTFIDNWAPPNSYGGFALNSHTIPTLASLAGGPINMTFNVSLVHNGPIGGAGSPPVYIFPRGTLQRILAFTNKAHFMDCQVVSYDTTTGQLVASVFSTSDATAPGGVGAAGQSYSDWEIRPQRNGEGFAAAVIGLNNMVSHGLPPRVITFTHGESAVGSPVNWTEANIRANWWLYGASLFSDGVCSTVKTALGGALAPTVYFAKTTNCSGRNAQFSPADIDARANISPESLVASAKGIYEIRRIMFSLENNVVSPNLTPRRRGPDLDWIAPVNRADGCHISDRGHDLAASGWCKALYGVDHFPPGAAGD